MKTFKEFNYPEQYFREGWFDKKEKEDPDEKELKDLGMKSAGRG